MIDDNETESKNTIVYCENCGCSIDLNTDDFLEYDGKYFCDDDCLDESYPICDGCLERHPADEVQYFENINKTLCDKCFDVNYYRCAYCDEIVHRDDVLWGADNRPYCEDCWRERFVVCERCGGTIWIDDAYYEDDDDYGEYPYCEYCYDRIASSTIYSYHDDDVEYIPRYLNDEDRNEHYEELYGIELEITGNRSTANGFQEIMGGNVVLMRDSSVEGYEMVSMPLSKQYFYKEFVPVLDKGLKYLRDNRCTGHNGGGIHIHFRQFHSGMETANATQVLYGDEYDRTIWQGISQRHQSALDNWCSMTNNDYSPQEILELDKSYVKYCDCHDTALNKDTRTDTHELRIFNSNLRLERVIKNMECLFALEDYVRGESELVCTTRGFIKFIAEHSTEYPYLVEFLDEKKLFEKATEFYGDYYAYILPNRLQVNFIDEDKQDISLDDEIMSVIRL